MMPSLTVRQSCALISSGRRESDQGRVPVRGVRRVAGGDGAGRGKKGLLEVDPENAVAVGRDEERHDDNGRHSHKERDLEKAAQR